MKKFERKYYLLNYIVVFGIILLFLNDHYFKWEFSNWITGKLSDFIGLLILPFFLTFFFPKTMKWHVILTGLFFVFWKSPFSQGFIDVYNSIAFIEITRVVDYSDLVALSILPLSYYFLKQIFIIDKLRIDKINIHPVIILFPSIIIFMATSPPYWHRFTHSEGDIKFYKNTIKVKMNQEEVLEKMRDYKIEAVVDTTFGNDFHRDSYVKELGFYQIDQIIIDTDTIRDVKFSMISFKEGRTKVFLNSMNISKNIKEKDVKNELRKYYRKLLRKYIKEKVK
ncbi:hypothetical protein [Flavivirga spongiicola]|uniref:Uncharacterized protein n=1 Tax=Flavivirga spongiicola TaxID=421621 RepID=A0ABU7XWH2_9FLAO|nr:hypothetical protein [Flavivirga sp. MEBiC05379]MDO5980121.1 hypothetical protein [Flavivirga sp. MEBiC05379]